MIENTHSSWSIPVADLFRLVRATEAGLQGDEAERRLRQFGPNLLGPRRRTGALALLVAQFKSPIILVLLGAAILSRVLGATTDSVTILVIVVLSGLLGFWQERGAVDAVRKLLATVSVKVAVVRDSHSREVPLETVVPGDIVLLAAGDVVPGDSRVLEAKDLFVDEATITGETYPAEKAAGILPVDAPFAKRSNALYMGTHVVSGTAKILVVRTGRETEFGKICERLRIRPPETEFERGVRRFGNLLLEVTLVLVIAIFAFNVYFARPVLDSLLFAVALAVGLTPQLLPAIITINLAHGAKRMAEKRVIVRRLAAIENFGSMNVLCTDKTGTITEGRVELAEALDLGGNQSERVAQLGYLNAIHESGFANPIDQAIRRGRTFDISEHAKLDEVPYDFIRKRLSILVAAEPGHLVITKGALPSILECCTRAEGPDGSLVAIDSVKASILQKFEELGQRGRRALGIAYREIGAQPSITKTDESEMIFVGLLVFSAPLKPNIAQTIRGLEELGVRLKIVTGDSRHVAASVGGALGFPKLRLETGPRLHQISADALMKLVREVDIFAEVEPHQKERIILALKKAGDVVGYMGDGINDATALHAADVGISVESAVDVAKDAADIVLLEKDLGVLLDGIREGRITFANTLKYVFMATSANFGNMFSMAGASLFLPFLPLLPKQVLLTNLLTDLPEMTIATDHVDRELIAQPRRWDIRFIRRFMLVFGLISSVFDYLTFGLLWFLLGTTERQFRTGWFVESVLSASMVVLVIRSQKPFFRSKPSRYLVLATVAVGIATLLLPLTPLGNVFELESPPPFLLVILLGIVGVYMATVELAKRIFYKRMRT